MEEKREEKRLVDFKKIKEEVGFGLVLEKLGLLDGMTRKGDEFVGFCPLHEGEKKKPSFYANEGKGIFQCFACKKKGSVLDFARLVQGVGLREAGLWLESLMNGGESKPEKVEAEKVEPEKVDPDRDPADPLEKKLEEVFLLLISRVEKHFENKEALAKKLTRWITRSIEEVL